MLDSQPWWWFVLLLISPFFGLLVHEAGHYAFGAGFGGNPSVAETTFLLPTLIDFKTPEKMTNWQVRVTGGVGFFWAAILLFGLAITSLQDLIVLFPGFAFLAGASAISWFDYFAVSEPEAWKKFTDSGSISREDIERTGSK